MNLVILLFAFFLITTLDANPAYQEEITDYHEEEFMLLQKEQVTGRAAIEEEERKERRKKFKKEAEERLRVYDNDRRREEEEIAHARKIKELELQVKISQANYERAEKARSKAPGNRDKVKEAEYLKYQFERAQDKLNEALGIKKPKAPIWKKY